MASFNLKYRKTYSTRSISLPARAHPLTQRLEEQLHQFKSSEATPTSSSSIDHNLVGLKDLLGCVHDLLQVPAAQKVLARERSDKSVSQVLDRSLRVLDVCSTTRDSLLQIKECAQDLQSALRRRRGGEHGFQKEVATYMTSRKQVNKTIHKCFASLKSMENKGVFSTLFEKDDGLVAVIRVLGEVEAVSLSTLESLLSFTSGSRTSSGWCLVAKIMNKQLPCQGDVADTCEMEKVDIVVSQLFSSKSCRAIEAKHVTNALKQLDALHRGINDLESSLECVYKSLIKARVTLLNILSQE